MSCRNGDLGSGRNGWTAVSPGLMAGLLPVAVSMGQIFRGTRALVLAARMSQEESPSHHSETDLRIPRSFFYLFPSGLTWFNISSAVCPPRDIKSAVLSRAAVVCPVSLSECCWKKRCMLTVPFQSRAGLMVPESLLFHTDSTADLTTEHRPCSFAVARCV